MRLFKIDDFGAIEIDRSEYATVGVRRTPDEVRGLVDANPGLAGKEHSWMVRWTVRAREGIDPPVGNYSKIEAQVLPGSSWKDIKDAQTILAWVNERLRRLDDLEAEMATAGKASAVAVANGA
jgi:hypothetical protein